MESNETSRLSTTARAQGGVLLGRQTRALIGRASLAAALRRGLVTSIWHGAYATGPMTLESRLKAAELTLGGPARPCLDTAAEIYGFDLSGGTSLHLLAHRDFASKRSELVLHRIDPLAPLVEVRGRPTMDPVETAVRVAAGFRGPSAAPRSLAVLDAALASGAVDTAGALACFADAVTLRGIRQVRDVADWADGRAESPRESWLRWLFLQAGFPPPMLQWRVEPRPGRWYRLDLAWPAYKVGCEYDGVAFHTGEALWNDRALLNDVLGDGWLMTMVTNSMLTQGPAQVLGQVGGMLRSRGASW